MVNIKFMKKTVPGVKDVVVYTYTTILTMRLILRVHDNLYPFDER